jgi:hypothetical protein
LRFLKYSSKAAPNTAILAKDIVVTVAHVKSRTHEDTKKLELSTSNSWLEAN